ncbi:hypothetical protein BDV98DRAFT_564173 [Pterulicium gracile]|uniref:Uncharacterized protein n=1 Tax=Pterulicium gracile TaxID=1884261 RepID=A0A5C3QYG6_9AGAR|nr:hypothetical protein BDV98DRAFT_564173 [Pterula gracilis]
MPLGFVVSRVPFFSSACGKLPPTHFMLADNLASSSRTYHLLRHGVISLLFVFSLCFSWTAIPDI